MNTEKNIGNNIKIGESIQHPNTLVTLTNDNEVYAAPSKFFFTPNKNLNSITFTQFKKLSKEDEQKYMLTPAIILSSESLLIIYDVVSSDDIQDKITELINKKESFYFINRLLNSWIKANLNDLKKNNLFLNNIYKELFNKYYPELITKNIDKKLDKFRKIWFLNIKESDFFFNFGENLKNFLSK